MQPFDRHVLLRAGEGPGDAAVDGVGEDGLGPLGVARTVDDQPIEGGLGVEHLRPLNLKTIADAIGMHESTVSRVTTNKYMRTPRGIFELKFFFGSHVGTDAGGSIRIPAGVNGNIGLKPSRGVFSIAPAASLPRTEGPSLRSTVTESWGSL